MDDLNDNLSEFDFDTDRYSEFGEDLGLDRRVGGIAENDEGSGMMGDEGVDVDVMDNDRHDDIGEEVTVALDMKIKARVTTVRDQEDSQIGKERSGTKGWSIIKSVSSTHPSTDLLTSFSFTPSLASPILSFSTNQDLINFVATILFDHKQYRSLINMSLACKFWKELVEGKVKKGNGRYRKADGFKLAEMTTAQKGLVK